jgi:2,4-dienoyl-CoA reductase-like NADH-dependent reductase (Old Yellow Enzyme family)
MQDYDLTSKAGIEVKANELGIKLPWSEDISILAQSVRAGSLVIPNSLAVHPMEGADGDEKGRPLDLTYRRYGRFSSGGAGLLWVEAIAVVPEGRANPRQLWLHDGSKAAFAQMLRRARNAAANSLGSNHKPVIVAQLTHSGRYSKSESSPKPIIPQRDPYRDMLKPEYPPVRHKKSNIPDNWPLVGDGYLDDLIGAYIKAARLAFEVGFDTVDIKSCHGYLLNEMLACHCRPGKYGGSFENRTRLLLGIIDAIRNELGFETPIASRLGIYDAIPYPYGWAVDKDDYTKPDLSEPKKLIKLLADLGVKLLNITVANPYYNPHYGRPYNKPIIGGYKSPEHPLCGVERVIRLTAELQRAFPNMVFVGTGYSWLQHLMPFVGAGVLKKKMACIIGAGRMALAYPSFAKDILTKGKLDADKVCIACSACSQIMRDGGKIGCVVRDNEIYGPIYKNCRAK